MTIHRNCVNSLAAFNLCETTSSLCNLILFIIDAVSQGWAQVQYLYLSTYLSVLDVLEYLVYGNAKVLVLVLVHDQIVLGTWKVIFKYYLLKSVKIANYLNTLL